MQVPLAAVAVPSEPLSPTSVLSDQESFIDCECADDGKRTEQLLVEEVSDECAALSSAPELRTEVTGCDDELVADSSSTLEKLQSVESVESAVTDTGSVGSRSVSDIEVGRRTSVIDPPSGFQTSTPSSKEDLDISETVLSVESQSESETDLNVESQPPAVEVPAWTKTDLRASGKLFRGQSVDVSIF